MPAVRVDLIEAKLAEVFDRERMEPEEIDAIRMSIVSTIDELLAADRELKDQLRRQKKKLDAQEERLLDLASDGTMPMGRIRARLQETALKRAAIEEQLASTEERIRYPRRRWPTSSCFATPASYTVTLLTLRAET